ncbi:MAG: DNA methyltransferase [bacterium]
MSELKLNFEEENKPVNKPVICLGLTFNNNEERREYFRDELRKKLPELKLIDGYPIGEDEDIVNLSDPPYYTACPNPWINDFIEEWGKEKEFIPNRKDNFVVDEPYASDISEGKNNPIYNAHSYHTKVPHPAIMRYILHYTQPGDIVFDGFAGTGMTGVAAQLCGNPDLATKAKIEKEWNEAGWGKPSWGIRKAILGDLSPIASFIAYNYNTPADSEYFKNKVNRTLENVEEELGWMYKTIHTEVSSNKNLVEKYTAELKKCRSTVEIKDFFVINERGLGKINSTVFSDVFICPECGNEIIFWEVAVEKNSGEVKESFNCPQCNVLHTKRSLDKAWITLYDKALGETIKQTKSIPVMISYSVGKKRFEKAPDSFDYEIIKLIDNINISNWHPIDRMPLGDESRRNDRTGITHIHHFYTKKSLMLISFLRERLINKLTFFFTPLLINTTKMGRYGQRTGNVSGTLYIPSLNKELNIIEYANRKFFGAKGYEKPLEILSSLCLNNCTVFTQSTTRINNLTSNSLDYIFTDPPFGANIMYSELNYIWESWIKVKTNNKQEAIENSSQIKGFVEYNQLMLKCFKEYYRVLKPRKWMTVEFSNTSAAVWNGIQTGLQRAGFIVANVASLDKQQGSFKAVTTTTAVNQDLIISCYKPIEKFDSSYIKEKEVAVWDFIREHLQHLPIQIRNSTKRTAVIERSPRILYDRLITFYLMRSLQIPIDAGDFQIGLKQRFTERDGIYFTNEQAVEYDELFFGSKVDHDKIVFDTIYSENDAVLWLRERLQNNSQTYQDIMPDFRKANRTNKKGEFVAELSTVLEENFIQENDGTWRVPNMNEVKDRETLRKKSLLKEFEKYKNEAENIKIKKITEIRVEALRTGFKMCWEKIDYKTIVNIAEKIPQNILLEDEQLLMFYDIAKEKL